MAYEETTGSVWTHHCRSCHSELIQPSEWQRHHERWRVNVRCPECGESYDEMLDQDQVAELSYAMEAGFQTLLEDLDELDRQLFEDECDLLISALHAGGLFPMDF